jgi:hypothetical protein
MKPAHVWPLVLFSATILISWEPVDDNWIVEKHQGYNLTYTPADRDHKAGYNKFVEEGITVVNSFFGAVYKKPFDIFIHPNRHSLDSTWQKDWKMPDFKSQCWMVASGVAGRLDMISPKIWDKEACEHRYADTKKTQQLITHELVHVYHGQLNSSPDFSNSEGIDWFVEGLATYASGQCDSSRIAEVKKAIIDNKIPQGLDNFWTGKLRYGISGSLVMYIDHVYGRIKLKQLLPLNKKTELLAILNLAETELINNWKNYMQKL